MPMYALQTVDDLRQLNQFYFYALAQDSVQGTGVFGEIAIGCGGSDWTGSQAGEGSSWSLVWPRQRERTEAMERSVTVSPCARRIGSPRAANHGDCYLSHHSDERYVNDRL